MPKITIRRDTIDLVKRLDALADNLQALSAEARAIAMLIGQDDFRRMFNQYLGAKRDNGSAVKPEA
jgi:hypothetical protein